jgi:TM2 domain-containing membrane protein YozV
MMIFRVGRGVHKMAVGDVVNGIQATGVNLYFQPALTVQCIITMSGSAGVYVQLTNGVTNASILPMATANYGNNANMKIMINNTNYLQVDTSAFNMCYSGMQIK